MVAPLFISDGWSSYQEPLEKHYSTFIPILYSGIGRPCNPVVKLTKNSSSQVVKEKGALTGLKTGDSGGGKGNT